MDEVCVFGWPCNVMEVVACLSLSGYLPTNKLLFNELN